MTLRVSFHTDAIEDARNARLWYAEQNPTLASEFVTEIERAIGLILDTPESWPPFEAGTRRFLLRRFPYSVVYRIVADELQIVAVAHARRRPGYWKDR